MQPDIRRVGGFSEALAVCEMAAANRLSVVPHAWKSGISVMVAAQLAAARDEVRYFEYLPSDMCDSRLRRELVEDRLALRDGVIEPPQQAGIGVIVDRTVVAEFESAAEAIVREREIAAMARLDRLGGRHRELRRDSFRSMPDQRLLGSSCRDIRSRSARDFNCCDTRKWVPHRDFLN